MASQEPHQQRPSFYPTVDQSNPNTSSQPPTSSSSNMYPKIDMSDLVNDLFPEDYHYNNNNTNIINNYDNTTTTQPPSAPPQDETEPSEQTLITIPGAVVHLIDKHYSVELAIGDFSVVTLTQGPNTLAVLARVSDDLQWPIMKDEAIVKVDPSHYFFSFPSINADEEETLNYGLSFAAKGRESEIQGLDTIFEKFGNFSVQRVGREVVGVEVAREMTAEEVKGDEGKREVMERNCGAYWTTLAPNVEDYSGSAAKFIAAGSGQLIKGILWCGDVTVDRLKWGHEVLRKRIDPVEKREIDKNTLKRIKRVKGMTKMTKKVATGVLSGVVRVSGFFTGAVINSKPGKKFFSLLPGELVLASLDGFNRICDAVEVAGKNVMSTTSTVTTGLVTHKYGEEAGKATHEGFGAAGHAIGTAWTVFKIRKALNPKSAMKPTSLAKSAVKVAAAEYKSKSKKSSK